MMTSTMDSFWSDVLRLLRKQHRFSVPAANSWIKRYRAIVADEGLEEATMHFGPEKFVSGIVERHKIEKLIKPAQFGVTFVKRLSANDVGETGSHQGGSIYIPVSFQTFFPPIHGTKNPHSTIMVGFRELPIPVELRFVYYRPAKQDRRLTPVPPVVIRGAKQGDFFVLLKTTNHFFGAIVHTNDALHRRIEVELAGRIAMLTPYEYPDIFNDTSKH